MLGQRRNEIQCGRGRVLLAEICIEREQTLGGTFEVQMQQIVIANVD
jgi:hypothetical protein